MIRHITIAGAVLAALQGVAPAQEAADPRVTRGALEYREACASCHGVEADGNGEIAWMLSTAPPDLRGLTVGNGGTFPFDRVYRVIDGRVPVAGHGPRLMPVWGRRFLREAEREGADLPHGHDPELVAAGRILVLIEYLRSIQLD
jgi:mono/diheme cytochrome c family protein